MVCKRTPNTQNVPHPAVPAGGEQRERTARTRWPQAVSRSFSPTVTLTRALSKRSLASRAIQGSPCRACPRPGSASGLGITYVLISSCGGHASRFFLDDAPGRYSRQSRVHECGLASPLFFMTFIIFFICSSVVSVGQKLTPRFHYCLCVICTTSSNLQT